MADNPETNENTAQNVADARLSDNAQLNPAMADALTRIYWQRRLEYQLGYYRKKARDFEDNVDNAFRLGAILMTVASLLAALGVFVQNIPSMSSLIALATAMIPAIASYITSFRQLYNWDRQLTIYRDTQLNLEGAKLVIPDLEAMTPEEALKMFPQLVQQVEGVIEKEAAQWGQVATGEGEEEGEAAAEFEEMFGGLITDSSGETDQEKMGALSNILNASTETPELGQYNLRPDELETQSPLLPDNFYGDSADDAQQRRDLAMAAAQTSEQQVVTDFDSMQSETPPPLPSTAEPMIQDSMYDMSSDIGTYGSEMDADMQALVGDSAEMVGMSDVSPEMGFDTEGELSDVGVYGSELDPELQALVGTGSPELDPELQALVGTGSPELDPELQALVGTGSPELDPELQALVGTGSPELDPELQALVGTGSSELDPELQALAGTGSPELDPELQALVGTGSPELDPELQALVGTGSPELDPELQALVGTDTPELDPELQALVGDAPSDAPPINDDGSVG